jgi:hypothetical protein
MSKMSVSELEELIFKIDLMLSDDKMSEGISNLFTTKESE